MSTATAVATAMEEPKENPVCQQLGHAWRSTSQHFRHCTRLGCTKEQRTYGYDSNEGHWLWVDVNARIVTLIMWPGLIPTYPESETVWEQQKRMEGTHHAL
ncbi:hypothetical protein KSD_39150 [Ktedonobacter sp. SOSP1-85]|uniref:hypothetical protein n=1 Tax=Ktedonobacter sp. SOSP1-85 TaxID=2778367 RepID=UPI0019164E7E|nr:hypothetical protein [Ktedonobacter sp. SOSP1-85]GHO76144.1 hypothetical protein KSD_39150 [Ktedonobacter sp. SOSP1-85]